MAKKPVVSISDKLRDMRKNGAVQVLPGTHRTIRLRSVDATDLLRENKMPEILTPLVVSTIYEESSNPRKYRDYLAQDRGSIEGAVEFLDSVEFIVKKAIADDTKVEELTLPEKKWIFQLALGPAELLTNFRLTEESDVETVADGEELQQATE